MAVKDLLLGVKDVAVLVRCFCLLVVAKAPNKVISSIRNCVLVPFGAIPSLRGTLWDFYFIPL